MAGQCTPTSLDCLNLMEVCSDPRQNITGLHAFPFLDPSRLARDVFQDNTHVITADEGEHRVYKSCFTPKIPFTHAHFSTLTLINPSPSLIMKLLTTAATLLAATLAVSASTLDVWAPKILSPKAGDVWASGERRTVTW